MERISFGMRLRQLRMASKLKQEELSELTRSSGEFVSLSWISSIERHALHPTTGKPARPTRDKVAALAQALGVTYVDLTQGTDYQEDYEETTEEPRQGLLFIVVPNAGDIVIIDHLGLTKRVKRTDSRGLPELTELLYAS